MKTLLASLQARLSKADTASPAGAPSFLEKLRASLADLEGVVKSAQEKVSGDTLPAGYAADLRASVGMFAAVASMVDGAVAGAVLTKAQLAKADLDAYTAVNASLGSVSALGWSMQDAWRDGDMQKFNASAKNLAGVMNSVMALAGSSGEAGPAPEAAKALAAVAAQPTAKSAGPTSKWLMTKSALVAWADAQAGAAALETPVAAKKRLEHLAAVLAVAKVNFEDTGAAPEPLPMTFLTVYAPFAGIDGAKEVGLSAMDEQKVESLGDFGPGNSPGGGSNFASSALAPPPYSSGGGAAGIGNEPPSPSGGAGQNFAANPADGGGPQQAKPLGKNADGWLLDMNAKPGSQFQHDPPAPIAKGVDEDSFGSDPTGVR